MTAPDIISIIRACAETRVTKFTAGDITVQFATWVDPEPDAGTRSDKESFALMLKETIKNDNDWMSMLPPPPTEQA